MGVEIVGLDKVLADLDQAVDELENRTEQELLATGKECKNEAQKRVPVRTGRLKNSISYEQTDRYEVLVGTNVEYAPYVEFGTRKMQAQPYLLPAFEISRKGLVERLKKL
ncbi:HK97 gp10 family phage protein [Thermosporothrix hazakensis]|jgi:HK97 gp10 family phage protein|uniref:HK97 gp10 family phage protein n=2 Tax=Thermosporothrix TaxID=768650 RepID=A0A326TT27_THEHA|nr:HK97-gp10 family putative phage morphogenesis protein [Thermosporothrix hazakensis]BBH90140.1 hypothetical protein KTC_48910 [Thermosporothrix sp. COM3]PZW19691.1 HK97 gp10 family phage protein [Thermosporothrix hazakensis]BBH90205.1 hypothetical protein KTC_49560 [Thermosporothrix sp. COM3]BBH90270.1 hypothetical protein KTC_50210 [Thermosporothrix sp. COM3]GCE49197.1 hypothetical protein KTH_40660 [Thermosporothrix hazakensis]